MKGYKFSFNFLILFLVFSLSLEAGNKKSSYSLIEIPAPSLKNNLIGTKEIQKIGVYLPPSYSKSSKKYPVVYFLNGYTVKPGQYPKTEPYDNFMKKHAEGEFILIELNGYNLFEGSMYVNSPVTGNWEDYVVKDVIAYVDSHFRTLAKRESRGIAGHSMGGGGTVNIALKHPEVYAVAYAMSPAVLSNDKLFSGVMGNDSILKVVQNFSAKMAKVENEDFPEVIQKEMRSFKPNLMGIYGVLAMGSAFSPDLSQPLKVDLPFKMNADSTFTKIDAIYEKWFSGFGNLEQKVNEYKSNLVQYRKFALSGGYQDEMPGLHDGAVYFSNLLENAKIPHSVCWYEGTHSNKVNEQLEKEVFPLMSSYLLRE